MGLAPKIATKRSFMLRQCPYCGQDFSEDFFIKTKNFFYPDGYLPICAQCIDKHLEENDFQWEQVDKLCQLADIPFVPTKWVQIWDMNHELAFARYAQFFFSEEFEGLGWDDYDKQFRQLKKQGTIEEELPLLSDEKRAKLFSKWGANYDDEALNYLENLYNGLMSTQNVNGSLQIDQALKLCKISYEIDCKIRQGVDFDKLLGSYDKLVKIAEFTPRNVKNLNDFDTIGELIRWLEKRGWRNPYYDGVTKDIVDETIKNIEMFNRRLYTNESGVGEQITQRIDALKTQDAAERQEEDYYGTNIEFDIDKFENDGYEKLVLNSDEEEFDPDGE